MTVINKNYEYRYSVALIKAMAGNLTFSLRMILRDHEFPLLKRGTKFKNRALNLFQADSYLRNQRKSAIKNVVNSIHNYATNTPVTIATGILKPINTNTNSTRLSPIIKRNHQFVVPDYYTVAELFKQFKQTTKGEDCLPLVHAIESTQHGKALYVHGHFMIASHSVAQLEFIENELDQIAYNYGYHVQFKQLADVHGHAVVINENTSYQSLGMHAVKAFTAYCYKQFKMPIPYGSNGKARTAYQRFTALSPSNQRRMITAIFNSTKNMRLRGHISFKRYAKSLTQHGLASIRFRMASFNVMSQTSLFNASDYYVKPVTSIHARTYCQQWRLARNHVRAVSKNKASGQSDLLAGRIAIENLLYNAIKIVRQADHARQCTISNHNEFLQNKNRLFKADYANGDRLRATGTPP